MAISVETRLGVSPGRRGKVWLCFHRNNSEQVKSEFVPDLLRIKDCAIYYGDEEGDRFRVDWDVIRMVVIAISEDMLTQYGEQITELLAEGEKRYTPADRGGPGAENPRGGSAREGTATLVLTRNDRCFHDENERGIRQVFRDGRPAEEGHRQFQEKSILKLPDEGPGGGAAAYAGGARGSGTSGCGGLV